MPAASSIKRSLGAVLNILNLAGINPLQSIKLLRGLPSFLRDYSEFRRQAGIENSLFPMGQFYPCMQEQIAGAGTATGHYFHQDLLVAQKIFQHNPIKHLDIGSRIDGFVAHIASFREIEVMDIRPLEIKIKNIKFMQADMMSNDIGLINYCDSISSLHAIEHFGLGRYGDPIDLNGHFKGLNNIYRMLKVGGKLYLSVPIGKQRVEFNAHRVFDVKYLFEILKDNYKIDSFSYVNDAGEIMVDVRLNDTDIENNYSCYYGCGIFELTKL